MALDNLDKINAYIERTNLTPHTKTYFDTNCIEMLVIYHDIKDPFLQISKAFELGRAKGFRAAKNGK